MGFQTRRSSTQVPPRKRRGRPFGAIGPTTASRMDFAAPFLMNCGVAATVGKGTRSEEVRKACIDNGGVYFVAVGGAAALYRVDAHAVSGAHASGISCAQRVASD